MIGGYISSNGRSGFIMTMILVLPWYLSITKKGDRFIYLVPSHFKWVTYQPAAGEDMLPQAAQSSFPLIRAVVVLKSPVGPRDSPRDSQAFLLLRSHRSHSGVTPHSPEHAASIPSLSCRKP